MAKPFLMLHLPPDALRKVCVLMNSIDLIELSFCSTKAKNILKTLLISPKNYHVKYTKNKKTMQFEFLNEEAIVWKFEKSNINEILERRNFTFREGCTIHKISLKIRKCDSGMTIYPSKSWSEEFLMLFFFGHFLQVFPAQIASLQLEIFEILSKNWFLEQVSAKRFFCETLDILGVPNISHISMALENIAAHHQIRIEPQIPIQYPVPENLTVPHLIIANGTYVSVENLKRINSRYCRIEGSKYSLQDIHNYISSFLEFGTGLNVEWLTVDVNWRPSDQRDMMSVFDTRKWNPGERDGYFSQFQGDTLKDLDCREGLDVERVDGIMATGVFEPLQSGASKFHFIVWKTRFPSVENVIRGREMLAEMERRDERNRWKIEENGRKRLDNFRKIDSLKDEIEHMKQEIKGELAVNMRELDDYALNVKKLTESLNIL